MRLLTQGHFSQVPEALCYYRQHAGQFTANIYRRLVGGKLLPGPQSLPSTATALSRRRLAP